MATIVGHAILTAALGVQSQRIAVRAGRIRALAWRARRAMARPRGKWHRNQRDFRRLDARTSQPHAKCVARGGRGGTGELDRDALPDGMETRSEALGRTARRLAAHA